MKAATDRSIDNNSLALRALAAADFDWCVRLRDVWVDNDSDVSELHGSLREDFVTQLEVLRRRRGRSPLGWPIVGAGGTGKTHLLGCFRRMTIERDAAFVLVDMTDVNDFWETLLQGYLDSLQELVFDGRTQQAVLLRRFLRLICPKEPLQESLPKLTRTSAGTLKKNIGLILKHLQKHHPQDALKNEDVIRAICCLNSENFDVQSIGLTWLQGQALEEATQREFGFTRPRQSAKDIVMALSWYMSLTGPTVVAFDQLDPIVHQISLESQSPDEALERLTARKIVQQIGNGFAALSEAYWTFAIVSCVESTWELLGNTILNTALQRFEPVRRLSQASSESFACSLVENRLRPAYADAGFVPPYPTWPFRPDALTELANDVPRIILRQCDARRRELLSAGTVAEVTTFGNFPDRGGCSEHAAAADEANPLRELDLRFEHLRQQVDVQPLLNGKSEDLLLAPLYVAALQSLTIEQRSRLPQNVDAIVEQDFPGAANARPLHARLRFIFHGEQGREEHYCVRGLEWANAVAYQNRLNAAMTQSGIDRHLRFRHLTIARTSESPGGQKTAQLDRTFINAGGRFHRITTEELKTLAAVAHLLSENDPWLDQWLQERQPVSQLASLVECLVGHSLLLPSAVHVQADTATPAAMPRHPQSARAVPPDLVGEQISASESASESQSEPRSQARAESESETAGTGHDAVAAMRPAELRAEQSASPRGAAGAAAVQTASIRLPLGCRVPSFDKTDLIQIPAHVLAKHTMILGGAGSGKTVTVRRIVEEAALAGIPSIVIDCAQDMSTFDESRSQPDPHWRPDDAERARRFAAQTEFVVYTPGKAAGRPLTLEPIPDLTPLRDDPEELESAVEMIHGALAGIVAQGSSAKAKTKLGILRNALAFLARQAPETNLPTLIALLQQLPEQAGLGVKREAELASEMADALKVEMAQNPLLRGTGTPLDPALLFGDDGPSDRVRISSISLIGLPSLEQQRSFLNQLAMLLFAWIRKNPHPPQGRVLRGLLVIDEARDFIPALKASSCKDSIMRLAAQARKYKLGLVLATQHPKDIDTKIVGNCATQFFGRMVSPASLATATSLLNDLGAPGVSLSKLQTGQFYVNFPDGGLKSPALLQMPNSLTAERLLDEAEILAKARSASTRRE